jgi:hypothetical protein
MGRVYSRDVIGRWGVNQTAPMGILCGNNTPVVAKSLQTGKRESKLGN